MLLLKNHIYHIKKQKKIILAFYVPFAKIDELLPMNATVSLLRPGISKRDAINIVILIDSIQIYELLLYALICVILRLYS